MQKVPYSKVTTLVEICRTLARNHQVKSCCSLTTGIFIMTAANSAKEALREEKDLEIPYWRTLRSDGFLNGKYPGGSEAHKTLLEKEGHHINSRGKRYVVDNFRERLFEFD